MNRAPDNEELKFGENQIAHQEKFSKESTYAKQAAKVHPIYAELAAATTMRTAYNFALSDWWHAPVIHSIQCKDGHWWAFASHIEGKSILAEAWDLPGHLTRPVA